MAEPTLPPKVSREIRREVAGQELPSIDDILGSAVPPDHPDARDPHRSINDEDIRDREEVRLGPETARETVTRFQTEDASEEVIDIFKALREMQGGESAIFKIHRVATADGSPLRHAPSGEYCGELGASQLHPSTIADLYGGGKYKVRGRYSNGQFAGERIFVVAADYQRKSDMNAQQSAGPAFNLQEFLALQDAREEKRRENAKRDRMEMIQTIGPILAPIIAAMVGRQPSPQTDLPALITALRPTVAPENPLNNMKGMMEMLVMMKDIAGEGGGSETAEILKSVSALAGPVLGAMAQSRQSVTVRPRVSPPTTPGAASTARPPVATVAAPAPVVLPMDQPSSVHVNPATVPGVDLSAPSQPTTAGENAMFAQLKPQIDTLVQIAENGADPIVVGDTFFEQQMLAFDDAAYNQFADFLSNPQCIDRLAIFNRDVIKYRTFFDALRERIVARIDQESQLASGATPKT